MKENITDLILEREVRSIVEGVKEFVRDSESLLDPDDPEFANMIREAKKKHERGEDAMTDDVDGKLKPITLKVSQDLIDRIDAMVSAMKADPSVSAVTRVTRQHVMRAALVDGLQRLERKYKK